MAKLVILNQGMTGRTLDLNVERATVGRVEENTFQISDGSVSSRHAEILLRGTDIVVKDLGSTNGTFINGEKISESPLLPGQILRFGQIELKIDDGKPVSAQQAPAQAASAPAAAPAPAPAPAPASKRSEGGTMVMTRGVSLTDLEQGGTRPTGFDTNTVFSKKKSKANLYFIIGGVVLVLVIVVLIIVALNAVKSAGQH